MSAHTLQRLLRQSESDDDLANGATHWGQRILIGAFSGIMPEKGIRGPVGAFLFMNLQLINDQTFENATEVGALR